MIRLFGMNLGIKQLALCLFGLWLLNCGSGGIKNDFGAQSDAVVPINTQFLCESISKLICPNESNEKESCLLKPTCRNGILGLPIAYTSHVVNVPMLAMNLKGLALIVLGTTAVYVLNSWLQSHPESIESAIQAIVDLTSTLTNMSQHAQTKTLSWSDYLYWYEQVHSDLDTIAATQGSNSGMLTDLFEQQYEQLSDSLGLLLMSSASTLKSTKTFSIHGELECFPYANTPEKCNCFWKAYGYLTHLKQFTCMLHEFIFVKNSEGQDVKMICSCPQD